MTVLMLLVPVLCSADHLSNTWCYVQCTLDPPNVLGNEAIVLGHEDILHMIIILF